MKIVKITQQSKIVTYDMQIKKNHNYIANNLVVHNSTQDRLIKSINPDCFEDIVAINAINRPGPLEAFSEVFGKWKRWERENNVDELEIIDSHRYPFEFMREPLEETYGCLLYQEQFMLMVAAAAGFNMGEADSFRRAIGWKEDHPKYHTVKKYFDKLAEGMKSKGYSDADVEMFIEYCREFMGYSFNKCLTANHKVISKTRGEINLLEVEIGEEILTYNNETNEDEYSVVENIYQSGEKEIYKIKFESGKELECSKEHKLLSEEGLKPLEEIISKHLKVKTRSDKNNFNPLIKPVRKKPDSEELFKGMNEVQRKEFNEIIDKIYEEIKDLNLYSDAVYSIARQRYLKGNFNFDRFLIFIKTDCKNIVSF